LYPHARTITDDLKIEPCAPIFRIELKTCRSDEPFTVFSGGLPHGSLETSASSTPPTTPTQDQAPDPLLTPTASSSSSSTPAPVVRGKKTEGSTHSLTVIHGKTTTVLEMRSNIVTFISLSESPYDCDFSDPFAVLVLLTTDLMVVDLNGA
jgi:syntaxin-binding protein 5